MKIFLPAFLSLILTGLLTLGAFALSPAASKAAPPPVLAQPMVAEIYASWCPACRNVAPAMATLQKQYQGKVRFVILDVSDPKAAKAAAKQAEAARLSRWFENNRTTTSSVGIFEPKAGRLVKVLVNEPDVKAYRQALDPLLKK